MVPAEEKKHHLVKPGLTNWSKRLQQVNEGLGGFIRLEPADFSEFNLT